MEEWKSLNMLYPNLGSELENRHSAHYSNLRRRFGKIYEGNELVMQTISPSITSV